MRGALLLVIGMCTLLLQQSEANETRLRMCPPGGSTFTMAWSMTCSMRRRRRSVEDNTDEAQYSRPRRAMVRPSLHQIKHICCEMGCTVSELLPFCSPFS
ncbi:ins-18 [Pristionchus pacificus]|uniref:Ins-18 n=1 Tax=Pristionchus pacificus TaxID=54126 RepID=A0A2A6CC97_PRIPA|nr:ins-18 [Pristionchus pacificus]|eukprot:PDM75746.1 ins-18 [Pristionchus pacificus]